MTLVQAPQHAHVYLLLLFTLCMTACEAPTASPAPQPNIILIVADDLGYGDLGVYGQTEIQTPILDQLAADGMRFTNFYAGSTVCAPSRSVLMTGMHTGRNQIRGNREVRPMGQQPLRDETFTMAEAMKVAGYRTGLIGKWGLGAPGSEGEPNRQGFDYFFGYLGQRHAHNFYPEFLFRNTERVPLPGNVLPEPKREDGAGQAIQKTTYSHDLLAEEAISFVQEDSEQPYFLLLTVTIPHANNEAGDEGMEVPDLGAYADKEWPAPQKGLAAMISRMDTDIGRLLTAVEATGETDNTLVLFTSDNGPHAEGGNDPDYFDSNGDLRGKKRDLYEGGIRVPLLAKWPGVISAGSTSDHMGYFGDFYTTFAEAANLEFSGQVDPDTLNSISMMPVLTGKQTQATHPYLYWEFYEQGSRQAVRKGPWKAVRQPMFDGTLELYNLDDDLGETTDLAATNPEIATEMAALMEAAHVENPQWQIR